MGFGAMRLPVNGFGGPARDPEVGRSVLRRAVALAWLLALSLVTLAIPGTGDIAHLEKNVAAASITLTDQDLQELA